MAGSTVGIKESDPDFLNLVGHMSRSQMATLLYEYWQENRRKFQNFYSMYYGKGTSLVDYKDLRSKKRHSSSRSKKVK